MKEAWICVAFIEAKTTRSMGMPTAYGVGTQDEIRKSLLATIQREMPDCAVLWTQSTQIDPDILRGLYEEGAPQ